MKKTFLLSFLLSGLLSYAQQEDRVMDSLQQALKKASPREKIYLYDNIALQFLRNRTDSAVKYAKLMLYWTYQTADTNNAAYAHSTIGVLYKNMGQFDSSLRHYFKAIRFQRVIHFDRGIGGNYNNIATVYKLQGKYERAVAFYHKALATFSKVEDNTNLNKVVQNLADLYIAMGEEEKAREELTKAEKWYTQHPNDTARAFLYHGFGEIYLREKEPAKAKQYLLKSIALFNVLNRKTDMVKAQIALGKLLMDEHRTRSCDSLIRLIEHHFSFVPSGYDSADVRLLEARLAFEQKKYGVVKDKAQAAIVTAQRIQAQALVMQAYELLSRAYEALHDPGKALFFFRQYKYLEDSINGLERQKNIAELETRYQVSEKENQIGRLRDSTRITLLENSRTSLQLQAQKTRNNLLWALAGVILVFLIVFYIRFRQKRFLSKQLQSSLSERELLIREIHHRVKNNLQIINSLLNLQLNREGESNVKEVIQLSQDRIHTMAMIHEKLYQSANLENISLDEYMNGMCSYYSVSYGLETRGVHIDCVVESPNLHIDQLVPVGLVLNELLINSIKYAFGEAGGKIAIACRYVDGLIIFTVGDNGRGLPADYEDRMKKSLGLQLVKGLTRQLKGTLEIKNQNGAVFELKFKPKT